MNYNLTESKFNMWRATVAIAHCDGIVSDEEISWLKDHFDKIPFSKEQLETIQNDIDNGLTINEVLPNVTHLNDRALLLHFANNLFRQDGFEDIEKVQYEQLEQTIMCDVDLMSAVKKVEMEMAKVTIKEEEEKSSFKGIFSTLTSYFEKHG